jgi:hypothetical protein
MDPNNLSEYVLWIPGGGPPTVKHSPALAAEQEASRLALVEHRSVFVLKKTRCFRPDTPNRIGGRIVPDEHMPLPLPFGPGSAAAEITELRRRITTLEAQLRSLGGMV